MVAAGGKAFILGVEHVEQAALADAELSAIGLDYLGARLGVQPERGKPLARGCQAVPGLAHIPLDIDARSREPRQGLLAPRLGFADARGIRAAAEEILAQAQHGGAVRI